MTDSIPLVSNTLLPVLLGVLQDEIRLIAKHRQPIHDCYLFRCQRLMDIGELREPLTRKIDSLGYSLVIVQIGDEYLDGFIQDQDGCNVAQLNVSNYSLMRMTVVFSLRPCTVLSLLPVQP